MISCWLIFPYWLIFSYWLLHEAAPRVNPILPRHDFLKHIFYFIFFKHKLYTMLLELTFFLLNWVPRRRIPRPRIPRLRIPPFLTRNPNYSPNTPLLLLVVQLLTHSHTFVQSRKKNFCSTIDKLLLLCKFYHQSTLSLVQNPSKFI